MPKIIEEAGQPLDQPQARQIVNWEELVGLENKKYWLDVNPNGGARIRPKEGMGNAQSVYLSTHSFYESQCRNATKILQSHGFNVELVPDGKVAT